MAFTLPTFNLTCNIFSVVGGAHFFRLDSPCNLAMGRRTALDRSAGEQDAGILGLTPTLLLPPLTDIRDASTMLESDLVEVPAGTGRFYLAVCVDDIGKGFPNEHRAATLNKTWGFAGNGSGLTVGWPFPIP
jgi:hypothetical protein